MNNIKYPSFGAYSSSHYTIRKALEFTEANHPDYAQRLYARGLLNDEYRTPNGERPNHIDWYAIKQAMRWARKQGGDCYASLVACLRRRLDTYKLDLERNENARLVIVPDRDKHDFNFFHQDEENGRNLTGGIIYHRSLNEYSSHT